MPHLRFLLRPTLLSLTRSPRLPNRTLTLTPKPSRPSSSSSNAQTFPPPTNHTVLLDNQTLYIPRDLALSLGWAPTPLDSQSKSGGGGLEGVKLMLHGADPGYFAITPVGSDSEALSRRTVESTADGNVKSVLAYLKER